MFLFILFSVTSCVQNFVVFDEKNGTHIFNLYVKKYNRQYENDEEKGFALRNFLNNLNKVSYLNENLDDSSKLYFAGMHADKDVEEFQEQYGVPLKIYYNAKDPQEVQEDKKVKLAALRTQVKPGNQHLYDLRQSPELYEKFKKKYNKENTSITDKFERQKQYYKFVKTLADLNRINYLNDSDLTYDENADILEESEEYFI